MKAVVQRVSEASVTVDGTVIGDIGTGLLILVCAMQGDEKSNAKTLATKISKLRIFADDAGKMNQSLLQINGVALVVSQFTLAADTSRGNRPGFSAAASPNVGRELYDYFTQQLRDLNIPTQTGEFGADMKVRLLNDGPVTISMDF